MAPLPKPPVKKIELKPVVPAHKNITIKPIQPKTLTKSPLGSLTPKPDADQKKKEILPIKPSTTSLSHINIIKRVPPPLGKHLSQTVSKPIIKSALKISPKPLVVKPADHVTPEPIKVTLPKMEDVKVEAKPKIPKIQLHLKNQTDHTHETIKALKPVEVPKKAISTPIKPIKLNVVSHKEPKPVLKDNLKPVVVPPNPVVKPIVPKMKLQPQVKKEELPITAEKKIQLPKIKANSTHKLSHIELKSKKPAMDVVNPGSHELISSQNQIEVKLDKQIEQKL